MDSISLPMIGQPVDIGVPLPIHEEDPYELVGMVIPGEEGQTEAMAQAFIEEFILLGWNEKQLMTLFTSPLYLGTHRIYQEKGSVWVQALIEETCAAWRLGTKEY
jgi:hypothetical protein